jgi:hypothetical protein
VDVPKVKVELIFRDGDQPLANEPCAVEGFGGPDKPLATDGGGKLSLEVPVTTREMAVSFPAREGMGFHFCVGDIDPVSESTGLMQRLVNLGYLPAYFDDDPDQTGDWLKKAVASFQAENGLDPTGDVDEPTRKALLTTHQT